MGCDVTQDQIMVVIMCISEKQTVQILIRLLLKNSLVWVYTVCADYSVPIIRDMCSNNDCTIKILKIKAS